MITDGAPGLIAAVEQLFPTSLRQRCLAHKLRNLEAKAPAERWREFGPMACAVYQASSPALARLARDEFVKTWSRKLPSATACFEDDFETCIAHGAKSDASDAYLLADLLRTDGHRFKRLAPQSDEIRALRALVRGRDDLVATRVHLANQLRSLLESFWPGAAAVFADIDSPIALAFIERYPTPESAARLGPKRMAAFCAQHAYSGRRSAEELLERLHQAPAAICADLAMQANGELVRCLARTLVPLVDQIKQLSCRIEHQVAALDDGRLPMSFPRAGRICAAQILAELGSVRERFATNDQLAAEAGVAPVTYQSGKLKAVTFRWACNHRLRKALTCLADNSRHASAWAARHYANARARGCDHPHAIRILARAWLRVIWRAWTDRKPYALDQHRGAQLLLNINGG